MNSKLNITLILGLLLITSLGLLAFKQPKSVESASYAVVQLSSDQNLIICKDGNCSVEDLPAPNRVAKRNQYQAEALLKALSKLDAEGYSLIESTGSPDGKCFIFKK